MSEREKTISELSVSTTLTGSEPFVHGAGNTATANVLKAFVHSGSSSYTLDFGSSYTDKAQLVVTGQPWVTTSSEITAQVLTPSGVDPDELRLLDLKPVISDLVAGVGFTITLYSETEAKGTYNVMCIGV